MTATATQQKLQSFIHGVTVLGGLILVGVIVWIDVATGLWQDLVILSGLAAGLVMFILTTVVLNRITERSTAKRWAPMNRLAITEFLHAIVDDRASEIARGHFVARSLKLPEHFTAESLKTLRHQVVQERRSLSDALSRWASFLTSSGDNERILLHVADIALQFDMVRDATLEVERAGASGERAEPRAELEAAVTACNAHSAALVTELQSRLRPHVSAHAQPQAAQKNANGSTL